MTESRAAPLIGDAALAQWGELLDRAFPVPPGRRFFDDFPVWDPVCEPRGAIRRLGIFGGGRLLAGAGLRIGELKTPGGLLRAGVVGAVATLPEARGKGFASNLVAELVAVARRESVAIVLLWGSEHDLYRRLGFELCGGQVRVPLASLPVGEAAPVPFLGEGWVEGLMPLLERRLGGFRLEMDDARWLRRHQGVRWFWSGTDDRPLGYVALGRGIDLPGLVHEWGGDRGQVLGILSRLHGGGMEASLLGGPWIFKEWRIPYDHATQEFFCMANILDPVAVVRSYLPAHSCTGERRGEKWDLSIGNMAIRGVGHADLPRLFFGPELDPVEMVLPVPLWLWGLDGA